MYSICKLGSYKNNEEKLIAVKILNKSWFSNCVSKEFEGLKREICFLKTHCSSELNKNFKIVQILEIFSTHNNIYIFVEYCNGDSLTNYIKRKGGKLS